MEQSSEEHQGGALRSNVVAFVACRRQQPFFGAASECIVTLPAGRRSMVVHLTGRWHDRGFEWVDVAFVESLFHGGCRAMLMMVLLLVTPGMSERTSGDGFSSDQGRGGETR